ncbi:hypothetical protein C0995_008906 [Termitomyces sp. Mi166|nr:hypothetical protein C0995_008906 [Termitomyces sp. Mi166\
MVANHVPAYGTNADHTHLTIPYNGIMVPNPRALPQPYNTLKVQGYNPLADAEAIMKACKGFGTDEAALIKTLTKITPLKMDALADFYVAKYGRTLVDHLNKETGSWFGMGLHGLVMGPLAWDVELLHDAVNGVGTNEELLKELIMDRSSEDLYRLSVDYKYKYGTDLSVKIRDDLSGQTQKLYLIALNARRPAESAPIDYTLVDKDILDLYNAGQGRIGTDETVFFNIICQRSPADQVMASVGGYGAKYRSLTKVIKSDLIIRAHWDYERFTAIKEAYHRRTGKTLESRVKSETSGDYQKLMLAIIRGD